MKKVRRLRKWVKVVAFILGFAVGVMLLNYVTKNWKEIDQQAIEYCIEQGYEEDYCLKGLGY